MNKKQIELINEVIEKYKAALDKVELALHGVIDTMEIVNLEICDGKCCPFCTEYRVVINMIVTCSDCPASDGKVTGCYASPSFSRLDKVFNKIFWDRGATYSELEELAESLKARIEYWKEKSMIEES